jgi:hypothetical protein
MKEWFEDESLWRELYPVMFPEDRFRLGEEQVPKILILTGFVTAAGVSGMEAVSTAWDTGLDIPSLGRGC